MNKELLDSIYTTLVTVMSGLTTNIYYDHLPDQKLLQMLTVVYRVQNNGNLSNFDKQEAIRNYQLDIQINAPTMAQLETPSIYVRTQFGEMLNVPFAKIISESTFHDFELNIYTSTIRYNIIL